VYTTLSFALFSSFLFFSGTDLLPCVSFQLPVLLSPDARDHNKEKAKVALAVLAAQPRVQVQTKLKLWEMNLAKDAAKIAALKTAQQKLDKGQKFQSKLSDLHFKDVLEDKSSSKPVSYGFKCFRFF
jgi:hypothetical protein